MLNGRYEIKEMAAIELNYHQVLNGVNLEKALQALKTKGNTIKRLDWSNCCIGDKEVKKIAEVLADHSSLTEVYLYSNLISDEGAKYIANALRKNKILQKLNLCTNKIRNDGAQFLVDAVIENHRQFELNLSGNDDVSPAKQIAINQRVKDCKWVNLTLRTQSADINFEKKPLTEVKLKPVLFNLRKQPVAKLKLINCALSDDDIAELANLIGENQRLFLEELDLSGNQITDMGVLKLIPILKTCTMLKKMNFANNQISEEGIYKIIQLANSHLTQPEFDISGNGKKLCFGFKNRKCDGAELYPILQFLKKYPCGQLSLINCALDDEAVIKLAAVIKSNQLVTLREIDLSFNQITDLGIAKLAKVLQTCASLEKINLANNKISDSGACALAEVMRSCASLQKINLASNRICEIGIEKIRNAVIDHPGSPELNLLDNSAVFEVIADSDEDNQDYSVEEQKPIAKTAKMERKKLPLNTYPAIFGLPLSALDEDHFRVPENDVMLNTKFNPNGFKL